MSGKLTDEDSLEMLRRYGDGDTEYQLAAAFGVSRQAVHQRLLNAAAKSGADYADLVMRGMHARFAEHYQKLVESKNQFESNKWERVLRVDTWVMERRLPALYGVHQQGSGGPAVVIQIANLRGAGLEVKAELPQTLAIEEEAE